METAAPRPSTLHWTALALLVISVCINYVDRGNLGVAARSIESDLHFHPEYLGVLLGGFFWTYSLFQIAAGKIIDRWNVNWVYAAGFLIWSVATGLTGLASAFWIIFCLRLVLGAGESVAYPAYSKIIATTFPEQLRGTANALIDAGSKAGPALGVLIGVKMIGWLSWRYMFVAIGAASLLWLIPWCFIVPKLSVKRLAKISAWAPPYREIVSQRALWGTVLGLFGGNYTWYLFLTWLPYYLERDRHYTHDRLAVIASLPFWGVAAASMLFGLLADAIIRRGHEAGKVRQIFVSLGLLGCCAFLLPAVLVRQASLSTALLVLACISMGAFSSNHWALTQHIAGAEAAGKWTGFQNCMGNFAGVIAPYVSGFTLQRTHSFLPAFAIACAVLLLGVCGYWFVVGTPKQTIWRGSVTLADGATCLQIF
ncbi:MAG TPA: MFS transporter [Bryobacteraceae bacterium]|nr:MFS transporter [Bryobacteraceae bacterium]